MQPDSLIRQKLLCPWDTDETKGWLIKKKKKKFKKLEPRQSGGQRGAALFYFL